MFKAAGNSLGVEPVLKVGCEVNSTAYIVAPWLCGWKNLSRFRAFLSHQQQHEQRWLSFYFFIRTGDGSGTFPECVRAGRAQRFIHHRSQLHRLFILLRRPTSKATLIKSSHPCPSACHLAYTSTKTLFHLLCFSVFFPSFFNSSFCLRFSVSAHHHSITSLTSNEVRTCFENDDMMSGSRLEMKHTFWGWVWAFLLFLSKTKHRTAAFNRTRCFDSERQIKREKCCWSFQQFRKENHFWKSLNW